VPARAAAGRSPTTAGGVLLEFLWEALGEWVLQLVASALAQACLHFLGRRRDPDGRLSGFRRISPWLVAPGYALFGAIAGAISVALFPAHMIRSAVGRITYLAVTPLAVGAVMAAVGGRGRRRHVPRRAGARFVYGCLFALALALVRHGAAQ
jgi:hypothetical protein